MPDTSNSSLAIALQLAAQGWPTFFCTATKAPAIPKLRGGNGYRDASLDPARIRQMAAIAGDAAQLVGVPCGAVSGIDALDLDRRHGSDVWLAGHRMPRTKVHGTMSGGEHWLFRHAAGVRNSAGKIASGCDVRGEGGYICFPPSPGYRVINDADIAEWPWWLLPIVLKATEPPPRPAPSGYTAPAEITDHRIQHFVRAVLDQLAAAVDGQKHYRLRSAAISLGGVAVRAGLSDAAAIELLIAALPSAKSWDLARRTAAWAIDQGRQRPISLPDRPRAGGRAAA